MHYTKEQLIEMETKFSYAFIVKCLERRFKLPTFDEISEYFHEGRNIDWAVNNWGADRPYEANTA